MPGKINSRGLIYSNGLAAFASNFAISAFHALAFRLSLAEVSLQKAFESLAVSCFVSCHFMNSVVDSVKVSCLCSLCEVELTCGSAVLSVDSHLEILLGAVGYIARYIPTSVHSPSKLALRSAMISSLAP